MARHKDQKPPKPLALRTAPSRRNPSGLPRCQRWEMRAGELWQCIKPARDGFPVCGLHGAGFPKREKTGKATNPRLGSLTTASRAKPETVQALLERHPGLRAMYDLQMNDGSVLLDLRPQLALAKVLAMHYVQIADLNSIDTSFGKKPPALAAIDAMGRVIELAERFGRIEEQLGPITHADLKRYFKAVADTILAFVPPEKIDACAEFLRQRCVEGAPDGVVPPEDVETVH